jgi:GNAT superfamily N-acetyltransferase
LSEQALVWVIYWYADNQEWLQKKLGVSDTDYVDIQQVVWKASSTSYLTELFVWSTARWRWISSALLDQYIALQSKKGLSGILTRTTTMKPYPMSSFLKRWFEQIYTYPTYDPRKRALFYKPL